MRTVYKTWIGAIFFASLVAMSLLFVAIYRCIQKMNQAESVNHSLFAITALAGAFREKHGRSPNSLEEFENCEKTWVPMAVKKLRHCFLPGNDKYIFVVEVNDAYCCVVKGEKDNYQLAISKKEFAAFIANNEATRRKDVSSRADHSPP